MLESTALEIRDRLRRGELRVVDVMEATLARVEAVNPQVNAIVSLRDADVLLDAARQMDRQDPAGALWGMPLAVKDLANVAGLETSMGSPLFAGTVAQRDDIMVARMRAEGAVFIGKTNTPEFGLGSHTFNPVHGVTRNPFDPSLSAGGSSGGAAVALATGMVALADGSDMMGSLRNPAGWADVYGFRPSWGRVPGEPLGDSFLHQLATNGPMARTPADIALLLEVMAGHDPRQPHGDLPALDLSGLDQPLRGLRLGWLGDWGGAYPMENGVLETCEAALERMRAMGWTVEAVAAPFEAARLWDAWIKLRSWAVLGGTRALYDDPDKRAMLKPAAIWEIEHGLSLSAWDVHAASVIRSEWFRAAARMFEDYDALILPSAQVWPFPVELVSPDQIAGQAMDSYHRWMEVVVPVSLVGLPCLAVPAGFGAAGLPMGLQLFGPRGSDARLLQMGQTWHREGRGTPGRPVVGTRGDTDQG